MSESSRSWGARGVGIASVVALAVVGGAAGGILWTGRHQSISSPAAGPVANTTASSRPSSPSPTSTTQSFADLYRDVNSGVVRIQATTCDGGGIGTGFLIAPDLVATVAHVVNQSAALNLTVGEGALEGRPLVWSWASTRRLTSRWCAWTAGCGGTSSR